jgi:CheY-like chemotaxis protein
LIAKGIVEQHAGTLEEGLGQGTTFTLKIPMYNAPEKKESPSEESHENKGAVQHSFSTTSTNGSLRILVVDDALTNRKLLGRLLKHHGHVCDEAENGDIAVAMVVDAANKRDPYDTVLLDYEMPMMNGPATATAIREKGFDVFIVGVTGNFLPDDVAYFRSCGANFVLSKPFKMSSLNELWEGQTCNLQLHKRRNTRKCVVEAPLEEAQVTSRLPCNTRLFCCCADRADHRKLRFEKPSTLHATPAIEPTTENCVLRNM